MAKIDPRQTIQKRRTEEEMRGALSSFMRGSSQRSIPPQDDDTDIVLLDCIEEVLQSRALLTEMRNFAQIWLAKATIKR
jgi:hypothetical protein